MIAFASLLAGCTGSVAPDLEPVQLEAPEPSDSVPLAVSPVSIGWDAARHAVEIEVRLIGTELASRSEPVYVGVTVITEADEEVDLVVHTLFPGSLDQSLVFVSEIAQTPKHVLIGAWNTKVEPCAVARPGCREFGFVLDDSLASFPARLYTEGMRQRFLPSTYPVGVVGDPARVQTAAGRFASIFSASTEIAPTESDRPAGVWVERVDDLGFAFAIAESLGKPGAPLAYGHVDGLGRPMVVVLP